MPMINIKQSRHSVYQTTSVHLHIQYNKIIKKLVKDIVSKKGIPANA